MRKILFLFFLTSHLNLADFPIKNPNDSIGQTVQIRGFWYPLTADQGILAKTPQLKSCCINAPTKITEQVLVKGNISAAAQRAITLEGTFKIEPLHNAQGELVQFYILDQAKEVASSNSKSSWIICGLIIYAIAGLM